MVLWVSFTLMTAFVTVLMNFFADPTTDLVTHLGASRTWGPSLIAFVVTLPITLHYLVRYTNQFAGPVFRLKSEMRALTAGEDRPPLKFRTHDYWQDLATDFNQLVDRIHELKVQASANVPQASDEPSDDNQQPYKLTEVLA